MALHLLGGVAKGQILEVPKGDHVKPTSVMLRRKLFDAHQALDQHIFIDLCAGTGAVGLEAWSRGAQRVYLIEIDNRTYRQLNENVKKVIERFFEEAKEREIIVTRSSASSWLEQFKQQYQNWDETRQVGTILFVDPPYEKKDIYTDLVNEQLRCWFRGRIWVESDRQKGFSSDHWESWGEQFVKVYLQGTSYVAVLDLRP